MNLSTISSTVDADSNATSTPVDSITPEQRITVDTETVIGMFLLEVSFGDDGDVDLVAKQIHSKMLNGVRLRDSRCTEQIQRRWIVVAMRRCRRMLNDIREKARARPRATLNRFPVSQNHRYRFHFHFQAAGLTETVGCTTLLHMLNRPASPSHSAPWTTAELCDQLV